MRLFDRYSNTLLVSLNNRISIRDTYGRAGVVDCQDIADPDISNNFRSESMTGTMIAETEVRESKSHDRIVIRPVLTMADIV